MSFDADEEILQDFLIEAGEILEQLSEQLVDLEQNSQDKDLLNAIFRGFHTVKGGAGFLQLNPLVDCCHAAENVFDTLRNGQRQVDADLMDVVLRALDAVNEMFAAVQGGEMPPSADQELIEQLEFYTKPFKDGEVPPWLATGAPVDEQTAQEEVVEETDDAASDEEIVAEAAESSGDTNSDDITDQEFEQLLDALGGEEEGSEASQSVEDDDLFGEADDEPAAESDEITEDEFEALLDQLHGKGSFNPGGSKESDDALGEQQDEPAAPDSQAESDSDEITDDEFEALLDQLHGAGKFDGGIAVADSDNNGAGAEPEVVTPSEPAASEPKKPAPKPEAKPAAKPETKPVAKPAAKPEPKPAPQAAVEPAAKVEPKVEAAKKEATKPKAVGDTTVRVDTQRLDDIMNMVGELVLVRNRLVRIGAASDDEELGKAVNNLDITTTDLQNSVMKTRMQPIKKVFGRFPRVVRDLARNLKKEINLELIGEETDLDKNLVEALSDPLVHLVRNSVDHGIEAPDVRESAGKPRTGKVILSAEQEGDHILLAIKDDGAGMDPEKLRALAVERGLYDRESADRLSETECFNLIFAPGFSTKKEISDVSGRGVGMDVVKTKISQLNGVIDIQSKVGEGTTITVKVPLTLAIMPTLMVMLEDQAFALPLVNVNEIFNLDLSKTNVVDGREVIVVRGKTLPLYHLRRWLVKGCEFEEPRDGAHVVVVSVGTSRVGFVVDQLVGQEEVVIKPLGKMLQGTEGMAGATITGDGRIALIIDVPSMIKRYS
ncbi:chemotaxis protein CheA [Salinibius halmophilus]|uniref:chemotaxis protein CheA n=1 Tax=Salinibius halmophilus TaxID=1853216 RepID=UPI000E667B61|nr:chemotaxis protein CheA [Salinibius halmophilus]